MSLTRTTNTSGNGADAHKVYKDAGINISPLSAINLVGSPHTFTATLVTTVDDGLTFANAPDGVTITFSFPSTNTAGAFFVGGTNTCITGDATGTGTGTGTCSVQVNGTTPGTVIIRACATLSLNRLVTGVVTRCTGDTATHKFDGADAQKTFVQPTTTLTVTDIVTGIPASFIGVTTTGSVHYEAFSDSTCTTKIADGGTKALDASGNVVASNPYPAITTSTVYFRGTYTGNLGGFVTACAAEHVSVIAP
ncbi:MAG: hypothetical protein M3P30_13830 [Chloroflexota bacterium]|nr:hypothetical protein [Chloroflexota bacterium]